MKTKIIFMLLVVILLVACHSTPYTEQDAKAIIKSRVKCVKVDLVNRDQGDDFCYDTYVAIDSAYNTFSFEVRQNGTVTILYKNGEKVK